MYIDHLKFSDGYLSLGTIVDPDVVSSKAGILKYE